MQDRIVPGRRIHQGLSHHQRRNAAGKFHGLARFEHVPRRLVPNLAVLGAEHPGQLVQVFVDQLPEPVQHLQPSLMAWGLGPMPGNAWRAQWMAAQPPSSSATQRGLRDYLPVLDRKLLRNSPMRTGIPFLRRKARALHRAGGIGLLPPSLSLLRYPGPNRSERLSQFYQIPAAARAVLVGRIFPLRPTRPRASRPPAGRNRLAESSELAETLTYESGGLWAQSNSAGLAFQA